MINSISSGNFTQGISFKYQNTKANNKVTEEANESTNEKLAETLKQIQPTVIIDTKYNKASALSSKTGNIIDFHA
jgi:hypothetical protein